MRTRLFVAVALALALMLSLAAPAFAETTTTAAVAAPSGEAAQLLTLVNQERTAQGLKPLAYSPLLSQVAAAHAQEMIDRNYFGHISPVTGSPAKRASQAGVTFAKLGENLSGHHSLPDAHQMLMDSPLHRANIMSADYDTVGLAIVHGGKYGFMLVEMFIKTPPPAADAAKR